jgi:hypothetical protein
VLIVAAGEFIPKGTHDLLILPVSSLMSNRLYLDPF